MKRTILAALALLTLAAPDLPALSRPELEFKIFQFPHDRIPRIDGRTDDWAMVPAEYNYGSDMVNDTVDGNGVPDPGDLDIKVTVGWVKGMNRLYFLYEAYDDFWDFGRFNPNGYRNDIFEIAVDGDLSGGPFIHNPQIEDKIENHFEYSGVSAQNYHIYTPPVMNAWVLVWGCNSWLADLPWSNYAYSYDFKPGESGRLVLECWITPFDYAPWEGPSRAVSSKLEEDTIIGLAWSILDFDGDKRDGHYNLAHEVRMVHTADYLCAFRLMPIEPELRRPVECDWDFTVVDMDRRLIAFRDLSYGDITKWTWHFGDGTTSNERNPIHQYEKPGVYHVVYLEVEGPEGRDVKAGYWNVMAR